MAQSQAVIKSLDDLLVHIGNVQAGFAEWDDINLKSLSVIVPVVIKGGHWDGRIDYRGARFIHDLQKRAGSVYTARQGTHLPPDGWIRATTKKGSNWLDVDLTDIIKTAITTMPPEYVLAFLLSLVASATGGYLYKRHADKAEKLAEIGADKDIEIKRIEAMDVALKSMKEVSTQSLEAGVDPAQPIRRYVKSMEPEDSISMAGGKYLEKAEALAAMPPVKKSDVKEAVACDGTYALLGIDLKSELPVLQIRQGDMHAKAMFVTRVADSVKNSITEAVDKSIAAGTPEEMALQMECVFMNNSIQYCIILGAGLPRASMKHYKLSEIPQGVASSDVKLAGFA